MTLATDIAEKKEPEYTDGVALQKWEMQTRVAYPLDLKIELSLRRIDLWYRAWHGHVAVSVSGKDSKALLHLVRSIHPDVPALFVDTGLEYPEVRRDVLSQENVIVVKPELPFPAVIEKYGWPVISKRTAQYIDEVESCSIDTATYKLRMEGIKRDGRFLKLSMIPKKWHPVVEAVRGGAFRVSDRCCYALKKRPIHKFTKVSGLYQYVGLTAAESQSRDISWQKFGCNAFTHAHPTSRPIMSWTDQDVLQYTIDHQLTLAGVYGEIVRGKDGRLSVTGVPRTGCMFCGFGAHLEDRPNRFERMRLTHPAQWNYVINKLGARKVFDVVGIPYGDEPGRQGDLDLGEGR